MPALCGRSVVGRIPQLVLDFRTVGVTVFHIAGEVKYPGIHRCQFNQFIALFYKIALQAVAGDKLWNNQFVVIGRCKHLVKGWPYLVTQIEVGRKNAQRPRFQALVTLFNEIVVVIYCSPDRFL